MNVPVFIEIELEEQAEELRAYFKGLGAEIASERSDKGFEDDLHKIIGVSDACFKETNAKNVQVVEEVLNGIVSMLAQVEGEKRDNLILDFCEKLTIAPANALGLACLKVLWTLYQSLDCYSPMRIHVYVYLVELAGKTDQIGTVYKDMDTLRSAFASCPPANEQMQKLLRLLHQKLLMSKRSEDAGQVMFELLGTYTTKNASQARDEAQRCIVASLQDPQTFLLDHLLQLQPVKFLEGELIHKLLKIFVSGRIETYINFYDNHREFVNNIGLNHELNMQKMNMLTFMQLAETRNQINFGEIEQDLQLGDQKVEDFLIDLLKTKLVRAKIDQPNQVVHITSTMHRTFTEQHWSHLHSLLASWRNNLHTIRDQISHLAQAQIEVIHQKKI